MVGMSQRAHEPVDEARLWRVEGLGGLEVLRANYGRLIFTPHAHEGFLIAVTEGGVGGPVFRGERHEVEPGDVLVLNPEEAHAGGPVTEAPWRYRALYPSRDQMVQIMAEFPQRKQGLPEFPHGALRDLEVAKRLRRFLLAAEDEGSTLLQRESYLTEALAWLVGRHATGRRPANALGRERKSIATARGYLEARAAESISLHELAGVTGLSPYYLCRVFRRDVGLAPHAYQTQVRVRRAKELLGQGIPIALAAAEAGFYDQAHFSRHFKRTVGVTPGEYVRAQSGSGSREVPEAVR